VIRYNISLIALLFIACIVQQFVPAITAMYDARVLIMPLVFLCGSVTGRTPMMLLLAFLGGFLWDCQHTLAPHGGNEDIYASPVEQMLFGYTIVLYGIIGGIMIGFRPFFHSGKWQIPAIVTGFIIYFYLWLEYLLINVIRGDFAVNMKIFYHNTLTAILTALVSPLLFVLLSKIAKSFNHVIRQDHLKRRYFTPQETLD